MFFCMCFREWLLPAAESQWTLHSFRPSAQKTPHCKLTYEAAPISQQEPRPLDFIAALHLQMSGVAKKHVISCLSQSSSNNNQEQWK